MPIRGFLAITLLSLFAAAGARASELEPADAEILGNILRKASGIQEVSYERVACRWSGRGPSLCTYAHTNGARDSFAWFKAARASEILLKYRRPVALVGGLEEVSITNLECGASLCIFE